MFKKLICWMLGCSRVGSRRSIVDDHIIQTEYYIAPFCKRCGTKFDA